MIKLTGSVGRMGVNKKHDVALVQRIMGAIKVRTKLGLRPIWTGKADGRYTREMEPAIKCLQEHMGMKPSGKLECTVQTMNALTRVAPRELRTATSVPSTSASLKGPSDPGREAMRIASETLASAPFPLAERRHLARAYRSLGPGHNICLERKKDWVTSDGRFATELEIDGKLSGTLQEKKQVHQLICRFITVQGIWEKGNPNDLKFRSKRQLKCLKSLRAGPLSGKDKKLLGLTTAPRDPVLIACAKGCAGLIRSGGAATNAGKKEAEVLIEVAGNADRQLGEKLTAAVKRPVGDFSFDPTTVANATAAITMLESRVGLAVQSLNNYDISAAFLVEKYFEPFRAGGLDNEKTPSTIAEIIAIKIERALSILTGRPFKQLFRPNIHGRAPFSVRDTFLRESDVVAIQSGNKIYLHEDRFNAYNGITQAAVLLHEAMHMVLRAGKKEDQKYIWQDVTTLGVRDAVDNADSYVAVVFDDVIGAIGQFREIRE
jgi:hypothetical protein